VTSNKHSLAESINIRVNSDKTYLSDLLQYGVPEFWEASGKYGDCEDYALAKRNALLQAGWDKTSLGLCICEAFGNGHCCLWVYTDKGSFILDNNYAFPVKPSELPYKWESMLCNGEWVQLNGFV
jgi:predicted transglutaminase-like cysteine proteinase